MEDRKSEPTPEGKNGVPIVRSTRTRTTMTEQPTPTDRKVAIVVFDCGEASVYGRGPDGRIDYDHPLPWPRGWPQLVTSEWLDAHGIRWETT